MRSSGSSHPGVPTVVTESDWGFDPPADVEGEFFAMSFVIEPGEAVEMTYSVRREVIERFNGPKRFRRRVWQLAGGTPLNDCSNHREQVDHFAQIASSAI